MRAGPAVLAPASLPVSRLPAEKRLETCSACGQQGHRKNNSKCPSNGLAAPSFPQATEAERVQQLTAEVARIHALRTYQTGLHSAAGHVTAISAEQPRGETTAGDTVTRGAPALAPQSDSSPAGVDVSGPIVQPDVPQHADAVSPDAAFWLALQSQFPDVAETVNDKLAMLFMSKRGKWAVVTGDGEVEGTCPVQGRFCEAVAHKGDEGIVWFRRGEAVLAPYGRLQLPQRSLVARIVSNSGSVVDGAVGVHVFVMYLDGASAADELHDCRVALLHRCDADSSAVHADDMEKAERAWLAYAAPPQRPDARAPVTSSVSSRTRSRRPTSAPLQPPAKPAPPLPARARGTSQTIRRRAPRAKPARKRNRTPSEDDSVDDALQGNRACCVCSDYSQCEGDGEVVTRPRRFPSDDNMHLRLVFELGRQTQRADDAEDALTRQRRDVRDIDLLTVALTQNKRTK